MDDTEELRNQDPAFITDTLGTGVELLQSYGWFLLLFVIVVLYLRTKLTSTVQQWTDQREAAASKKVDSNKAMQQHEAIERARAKMQEQLDAQAKLYVEKQKEIDEKKRLDKLADYDAFQQGKSRLKKTDLTTQSTSSSSQDKPKKPSLRPAYNPLMGDTGGSCFRPTRRGGGASGGG